MMDKDVQLLIVGVIGTVAILTVFTKQSDLSQVCVAGLIGFLGAKAGSSIVDGSRAKTKIKNEEDKEIV